MYEYIQSAVSYFRELRKTASSTKEKINDSHSSIQNHTPHPKPQVTRREKNSPWKKIKCDKINQNEERHVAKAKMCNR